MVLEEHALAGGSEQFPTQAVVAAVAGVAGVLVVAVVVVVVGVAGAF